MMLKIKSITHAASKEHDLALAYLKYLIWCHFLPYILYTAATWAFFYFLKYTNQGLCNVIRYVNTCKAFSTESSTE